ncbi:hypothetical protein ACFL29_00270 [Patescibacteria group bacterium]
MFKAESLQKIIKFCVYLALIAPLVYIPQTIYAAVFGKMIYFQIVIELALPFFLYLIIFYKRFRPKLDWLTKIILLFFAAIFLSSFLGSDFAKSFWGYDERMRGLFSLSHFLLLYFYIITCFRNAKDKKRLLIFTIFIAILVSIFGIMERLNPTLRIDNVKTGAILGHRVSATTGNPIFLGGYVLFTAFISLYYLLRYKDWSKWVGLIGFSLSF